MSDREDLTQQVEAIKKSKLSIAEALKELDIAKSAFVRSDRIEERQTLQERETKAIQEHLESFVTAHHFNQRIEEVTAYIDKSIKVKIDEALKKVYAEMSQKLTTADLEEHIKNKVNYSNFVSLTQQVNSLKTKVEKHIYNEFEGFKTKMKIELSHKANETEDMHADLMNNEEIISLKSRINTVEQQLRDIISQNDEMLEDDEDYDSEEELDNMNEDDLVRALMKDKKKEEESSEMPSLQAIKPKEETPVEAKAPESSEPPAVESTDTAKVEPVITISEPVQKEPESVQKAPEPVQKAPEPVQTASEPVQKAPEPVQAVPESVQAVPEPVQAVPEPVQKAPEPAQKAPEPVQPVQKKPEVEPPQKLLEPESPSKGEDEIRAKDSASRPAMSRVGSRTSSMGKSGVGAVGGNAITQVNKKITLIKKDIESFRKETDDIRKLIMDNEREIEETHHLISELRGDIRQVSEASSKMETSFIKALRRKGIEQKEEKKKKAEPVMTGIPPKEMEKIHKIMQEKTKRIIALESFVDKVVNDTNQLKLVQREKLNEIIQSLHFLNEARNKVDREFSQMQKFVVTLEENLRNGIEKVQSDVFTMQQPLTSLISDQQRENQQLTEDIKRHQGMFRNLVEDYIGTLDYHRSIYTAVPHERSQSIDSSSRVYNVLRDSARVHTASPNVSLKQRFATDQLSGRMASPPRVSENWISALPEGHMLNLPRMPKEPPKTAVHQKRFHINIPPHPRRNIRKSNA